MRTLIRPTAFVDSPFGHDGKVARLAGGLNWFAGVELIAIEGRKRASAELVPFGYHPDWTRLFSVHDVAPTFICAVMPTATARSRPTLAAATGCARRLCSLP